MCKYKRVYRIALNSCLRDIISEGFIVIVKEFTIKHNWIIVSILSYHISKYKMNELHQYFPLLIWSAVHSTKNRRHKRVNKSEYYIKYIYFAPVCVFVLAEFISFEIWLSRIAAFKLIRFVYRTHTYTHKYGCWCVLD